MHDDLYEDDDFYEQEVCECELDWTCGLHAGQPTPEDRIATAWSHDHP